MATDDIITPTISSDGLSAVLLIEGRSGLTVTGDFGDIDASPAVSFAVVSEGYNSSGVLGTVNRTVYGVSITSQTDSGGNRSVTIRLSEPIFNDDKSGGAGTSGTDPTVTVAAGAFTYTGGSNSAATAVAVTNNSALDYPRPTACIVSEVFTRETGNFYVDVLSFGAALSGLEANAGIARVAVTVTDNARGSGAAATKATTSLTLIDRIGSDGHRSQWQAFRAGPFNPDDGGDWTTAATAGLATISGSIYPKIGDADSVVTIPSRYIYLDPADAYDVQEAYLSTTGNDGTGVVGNRLLPFADMHTAVKACQTASSNARASFSTIWLEEGEYLLGTYAFGNRSDTSDGPVIIAPVSDATAGAVKVVGSVNSSGLRTMCVMLKDLTVEHDASSAVNSGAPAAGTGGPLGSSAIIILKNVDVVGPGIGQSMAAVPINGFSGGIYIYGGSISECNVLSTGNTIRDRTFSSCSGDANNVAVGGDVGTFFCNNIYEGFDPLATGNHLDIVQFVAANGTYQNIAFCGNLVRNSNEVQCPLFANLSGNTATCDRIAVCLNIFESDNDSTIGQMHDGTWQNFFFYHNSVAEGLLYVDDNGSGFSGVNAYVLRNYFHTLSTSGTPNYDGFVHDRNHNTSGTITAGTRITTGSDEASLFVDWSAGDYKPAGALLSRWTNPIFPRDAFGVSMPSDGTGAIGALQLGSASSSVLNISVGGSLLSLLVGAN